MKKSKYSFHIFDQNEIEKKGGKYDYSLEIFKSQDLIKYINGNTDDDDFCFYDLRFGELAAAVINATTDFNGFSTEVNKTLEMAETVTKKLKQNPFDSQSFAELNILFNKATFMSAIVEYIFPFKKPGKKIKRQNIKSGITHEIELFMKPRTADLLRQIEGFLQPIHTIIHPSLRSVEPDYYFDSIFDVVTFEFYQIIKNDIQIKICENCGKAFVPISRSDEKYCYYENANGKTCRDVGYENKLNADVILKTYRTIYKTQNARKQRNKDNVADIDARFEKWKEHAKTVLNQCKNGEIDVETMKASISGTEWLTGGDPYGNRPETR